MSFESFIPDPRDISIDNIDIAGKRATATISYYGIDPVRAQPKLTELMVKSLGTSNAELLDNVNTYFRNHPEPYSAEIRLTHSYRYENGRWVMERPLPDDLQNMLNAGVDPLATPPN